MIRLAESVRIALEVIAAHKLRSFLTCLGNIVAVASIVAVVALIDGMNVKVNEVIISETGADTFVVRKVGLIRDADEAERAARRNPPVTFADLQAVDRRVPSVRATMARVQGAGRVVFRNTAMEGVRIEGVTDDYVWFPKYVPELGRLISTQEVDRRRQVALLGWDTAEKLFQDASPLEQIIRVQNAHFRVVGVLRRRGALFGHSQDEFIVLPMGAFAKLFGRRPLEILAQPTSPALQERAMDEARVALRVHRRLRPSEPDDFGILNARAFVDIWRELTSRLFAVLIGVVALSLLVGGIVIMNIMLMVVTERTNEIGLRKALGARKRDIVGQILTEAVTLSVIGGLVGTALGFASALAIEGLTPMPAEVKAWSVVLGVTVTMLVGLCFGLYPALVAANMDPIEAIRRE